MKLQRLEIDRLPGLSDGFTLDGLGPGLNLIVGPNGVGKSRLCAAVRGLLWSDRFRDPALTAAAVFEHRGQVWRVERDGSRHQWQCGGADSESPELPPIQLDGCFFLGLRDLLDDRDATGSAIASRIRRQMAGGFDLDAVVRPAEDLLKPRAGDAERRALDAAQREVHAESTAQDLAAAEIGDLDALREQSTVAHAASRRANLVKAGIDFRVEFEALAALRAELAALPASLAQVDGKEEERLQKNQQAIASRKRERDQEAGKLRESEATVKAAGLEQDIDPAEKATAKRHRRELEKCEQDLIRAREDEVARESELGQRRIDLGAAPDAELEFKVEDGTDLYALLEDHTRYQTQLAQLQEEQLLLGDQDEASANLEPRISLLRRAAAKLREWLRASDAQAQSDLAVIWPARWVWFALGGGVAIVGLGLVLLAAQLGLGLALVGLGAGLVVAGAMARSQTTPRVVADLRAPAEQDYPPEAPRPTAWQVFDVTQCLIGLEDELARVQEQAEQAKERAKRQKTFDARQKELDELKFSLDRRRRQLAGELGLTDPLPAATMVELATRLSKLRDAQVAHGQAQAKVYGLSERFSSLLSGLGEFLTRYGEASPADAASAEAGIDALDERSRSRSNAVKDSAAAQTRLNEIDADLQRLDAERHELFQTLGLADGDLGGLQQLLARFPEWRKLSEDVFRGDSVCQRLRQELEGNGEGDLADWDLERLHRLLASLNAEAERFEELNRNIGRIEDQAKRLRQGDRLEAAIAVRDEALVRLRERRDQLLDADAARFLIEQVREEHQHHQNPRVLQEAKRRFQAFTHHRYELIVDPDDEGSFIAIGHPGSDDGNGVIEGRGYHLNELSDGTRAQLVLAARMAFAQEAGRDADLPLFLDEALDHSDPERFNAIAVSLARTVADEARQVFYLTNDPTDVERFQSAFDQEGCSDLKVFDLGAVRGAAASLGSEAALRIAPLDEVPPPDGAAPESYGLTIEVAPLNPRRDPMSLPVYYLLRDDLKLLHRLLSARLSSIGQCRNLLRGESKLARSIVSQSAAGRDLAVRIELFESFCLAWREGRGQPVDRLTLEASAAVSRTYIEQVVEIARELGGDPVALIEKLRSRGDPRLSRFQTKTIDRLESYLVEQGYVAQQAPLDESEINARLQATPAAAQLGDAATAELNSAWWRLCAQAVA